MNKSVNFSSLLLATGVTGVALFAAANLATLVGFEIAEVVSFLAAAAIVAFAVNDYARRPHSLRLPVATPRLLANANLPAVAAGPRARATAYGLPRNRSPRVAA